MKTALTEVVGAIEEALGMSPTNEVHCLNIRKIGYGVEDIKDICWKFISHTGGLTNE